MKDAEVRGGADTVLLPPIEIINIIEYFGCPSGAGVDANTKMMEDVKWVLVNLFDKKNLCCNIP